MKNELKIFLTALMFYTRIPVPKSLEYAQDKLNKATRYFPLIGWFVGGGVGLIFYLSVLLFSLPVAIVLAMIVGVLMTGAFHEDGFADTCDGFGGGWTKERILEIMKDSRSGAYGVIGMVLLLLLKFLTIFELAEMDVLGCTIAIIFAQVVSRMSAVYIVFTEEYVREDELSKAKPIAKQLSLGSFLVAMSWGLPALIFFKFHHFICVLILVFFMTMYLKRYFKKWIGGYTGDCLGATQQVNEILVYLSLIVAWKFF